MFDVIIAANGKSIRCGTDKLSAKHGDGIVLTRTINAFRLVKGIGKLILVSDSEHEFNGVIKTPGGATRAESVRNGLKLCTSPYVLIHDGARPFVSTTLIETIARETEIYGSAVPQTPITDSLKVKNADGSVKTANRNDYFSVQTPQGFAVKDIVKAYEMSGESDLAFDESELYEKYIAPVHYVLGERTNKKITEPTDLIGFNIRVGTGFDVHKFADNGKPLMLGGIPIPYKYGLEAHSDGDVVIHAVMDALLSSANQPDIGVLFPDNDIRFKDIDSKILLREVADILKRENILINNISVTVIAQEPKLKNHVPSMEKSVSSVLGIPSSSVNINCTTTENLGIVGEKKAIAVLAVCSVF